MSEGPTGHRCAAPCHTPREAGGPTANSDQAERQIRAQRYRRGLHYCSSCFAVTELKVKDGESMSVVLGRPTWKAYLEGKVPEKCLNAHSAWRTDKYSFSNGHEAPSVCVSL